jgi:hypothetical protein
MTSRHKIFRKQGDRGAFDVSSPSIARQGLRLSLCGESASRRCSKLSVPGNSGVLHPLRGGFEANATAAFAKEAQALRREWSGIEPQFQPAAWKMQLEILDQKAHHLGRRSAVLIFLTLDKLLP